MQESDASHLTLFSQYFYNFLQSHKKSRKAIFPYFKRKILNNQKVSKFVSYQQIDIYKGICGEDMYIYENQYFQNLVHCFAMKIVDTICKSFVYTDLYHNIFKDNKISESRRSSL